MKSKRNIKDLLKRLKTNLTNRLGVEDGYNLFELLKFQIWYMSGKLNYRHLIYALLAWVAISTTIQAVQNQIFTRPELFIHILKSFICI